MRAWLGRLGLPIRDVRVPTRLQFQTTECGIAALAMVLAHHGLHVSNEELRGLTGVSRDCVNAAEMARAARSFGFECKAYSREPGGIRNLALPFLVHLRFIHFVVVEGFTKTHVLTNDPGMGRSLIPLEKFEEDFTGIVLAIKPGPAFEKRGTDTHPFLSLWRRLDEPARINAIMGAAARCLAILSLPFLANALTMWPGSATSLAVLACVVLYAGLLALSALWFSRLAHDIRIQEARTMARLVESLEAGFFSYRLPSQIHNVFYASDGGARLVAHGVLPRILALCGAAVAVVTMFWIHPGAGAAVTFVLVAATAAVGTLFRLKGETLRARRAAFDDHETALRFSREDLERARLGGADHDFVSHKLGAHARLQKSTQDANETLGLMNAILAGAGVAALTIAAAAPLVVWTGWRLEAGAHVALLLLVVVALEACKTLPDLLCSWDQAKHALLPIDDLLTTPTPNDGAPAKEAADPHPPSSPPESIMLEAHELTFGYSSKRPPLVQGLSLCLARGEQLGLTGPSGGGKSTIAGLLAGLHQPWSGGLNRAPGSRVALIDKVSFFFEGSLRDNLCLWNPKVSDAALERAVSDACLTEVIGAREGGLETKVEPRGRNFSGGQRQRIEIARALLNEPDILVLDDAMDALDPALEARIRANLKQRGCSIVVVGHRGSSLAACDRVLRVAGGRVEVAPATAEEETNRVNEALASAAPEISSPPPGPPVVASGLRTSDPEVAIDDGLFAGLRETARRLGVAAERIPGEVRERSRSIADLARLHGLRARRIRFVVPGWWRLASGAVLAVSRESRTPKLLATESRRSPVLVDPVTKATDGFSIEALSRNAWEFLPEIDPRPQRASATLAQGARAAAPEFVLASLNSLFLTTCLLVAPWLLWRASAGDSHGNGSILAFTAGVAVLATSVGLFEYARLIAIGRGMSRTATSFISAMTQRLVRLTPGFVNRTPRDDLGRAFLSTERLVSRLQEAPMQMLSGITLLSSIVLLSMIDLRAGLAAAVYAGAIVALTLFLTIRRIRGGQRAEAERVTSHRFLFEVLRGFRRLQILGYASRALDHWILRHEADVRSRGAEDGISARQEWLRESSPGFALLAFAVLLTLTPQVNAGALTWPAQLLLFLLVARAASDLGAFAVSCLRARLPAAHADLIARGPVEPTAAWGIERAPAIELHDITYRYPGTSTRAIDGISLRIEPGEFVALTGPSGGGKSTLLRLIVGNEEPESGEVRLGTDVARGERLVAFRRMIGLVSQDERLDFSTTLRHHVGGTGSLGIDAVWKALTLTLLADDIARMPMGIQTIVETGRISAGQEQRVLMARELARQPKILVLDEATNAIPDAVQSRLFANLRALGLTCILVTHRESALALVDRVMVIENGKLAWSGPPKDLAEETGLANMLYAERLEGF
jgi:ABC-type bacteriocin/lantibiotic exporter with double-glycine peptidase domain